MDHLDNISFKLIRFWPKGSGKSDMPQLLQQATFWLLHQLFEIRFYELSEGATHNLSAVGVAFVKEI